MHLIYLSVGRLLRIIFLFCRSRLLNAVVLEGFLTATACGEMFQCNAGIFTSLNASVFKGLFILLTLQCLENLTLTG